MTKEAQQHGIPKSCEVSLKVRTSGLFSYVCVWGGGCFVLFRWEEKRGERGKVSACVESQSVF